MHFHSLSALLVFGGAYGCNAQSLALVANVTHMIGYEAEHPFEHVNGSACCLDVSIEVDSLEACRSHCQKDAECGSFLFNAAERQCFLVSQFSNFKPVDGPHGCERRCVEQKECEAFVFQPSNKLCFLIQFTAPELGGAARRASIGPAQDRIFGLVRDCVSGSIQAEISRSILGDGGQNDSVARVPSKAVSGEEWGATTAIHESSMPLDLEVTSRESSDYDGTECWDALLGSVLAAISLIGFASLMGLMGRAMFVIPRPPLPEVLDISHSPRKPNQIDRASVMEKSVTAEGAMPKTTSPTSKATTSNKKIALVAGAVDGAPSQKEPSQCLRSEQIAPTSSTSRRTLAAVTSSTSGVTPSICKPVAPASSDPEPSRVASAVNVSTSACSEGVMRMFSQAVPPVKAFVPVQRRVDFAGPTNYPVAGETSPHARSTPQKVLLREITDDEENSARVDAGLVPNDDHDEERTAKFSDRVFLGIPEVMLMLGALFLSALNFEHRTVAVIALTAMASLYLAARCVAGHDVAPRSGCLTQANLQKHNAIHSELPDSKAHHQDKHMRAAVPKYGVKSSRQTPAHFEVQTCKGGG